MPSPGLNEQSSLALIQMAKVYPQVFGWQLAASQPVGPLNQANAIVVEVLFQAKGQRLCYILNAIQIHVKKG